MHQLADSQNLNLIVKRANTVLLRSSGCSVALPAVPTSDVVIHGWRYLCRCSPAHLAAGEGRLALMNFGLMVTVMAVNTLQAFGTGTG